MSIPKTNHTPENDDDLPPARRRRAKRHLIPEDLISEAEGVEKLAQQTSPSFDFFLFSFLAAAILVVGVMLDSPAIFVLGALAAPPLTPVVGISLGAVTGSFKFFIQRFMGTFIASLFVFIVGVLGGYASQAYPEQPLPLSVSHAQVSWSHITLLVFGSIFITLSLVQKRNSPVLPSVALAYELYIPLSIAGFGLGSGRPHLFPDGLVVYATHLAVLSLLGTFILFILGFRPLTFLGYTLGSVITILGIITLIGLSSAGAILGGNVALPTATPTPTLTPTPLPPTATSTNTPLPPTNTPTPTVPTPTPTPTRTQTSTPTLTPTPIFAEISVPEEYQVAAIREEPSLESEILTFLPNGTLIEIIDPTPILGDQGWRWVKVRIINENQEGWIVENLLLVATPRPEW